MSSPYTAPKDGWAIFCFGHYSTGNNTFTPYVNEVLIGGFSSHDYDNQNLEIAVKAGDVLTWGGASVQFAKFCGMRSYQKYSSVNSAIKYI